MIWDYEYIFVRHVDVFGLTHLMLLLLQIGGALSKFDCLHEPTHDLAAILSVRHRSYRLKIGGLP